MMRKKVDSDILPRFRATPCLAELATSCLREVATPCLPLFRRLLGSPQMGSTKETIPYASKRITTVTAG
jgi:hypothetical protein